MDQLFKIYPFAWIQILASQYTHSNCNLLACYQHAACSLGHGFLLPCVTCGSMRMQYSLVCHTLKALHNLH